jgi:hypothetical protein
MIRGVRYSIGNVFSVFNVQLAHGGTGAGARSFKALRHRSIGSDA